MADSTRLIAWSGSGSGQPSTTPADRFKASASWLRLSQPSSSMASCLVIIVISNVLTVCRLGGTLAASDVKCQRGFGMSADKFKTGDLVYIGKMPWNMRHFDGEMCAMIAYSYRQEFGGGDSRNYAVFLISDGNSPVTKLPDGLGARAITKFLEKCDLRWCAWYEEDQMSLLKKSTATMELFARRKCDAEN